MRIHPIHEGTTGIQGMDLLGRKMTMKKGRAGLLYLAEVRKTIQAAQADDGLKPFALDLEKALSQLEGVTAHLIGIAMKGRPGTLPGRCNPLPGAFGIIAIAWQWLLQAVTANKALKKGSHLSGDMNFYTGKIYACRYFYGYELPKIEGLIKRLMNSDGLTVEMKNEYFEE